MCSKVYIVPVHLTVMSMHGRSAPHSRPDRLEAVLSHEDQPGAHPFFRIKPFSALCSPDSSAGSEGHADPCRPGRPSAIFTLHGTAAYESARSRRVRDRDRPRHGAEPLGLPALAGPPPRRQCAVESRGSGDAAERKQKGSRRPGRPVVRHPFPVYPATGPAPTGGRHGVKWRIRRHEVRHAHLLSGLVPVRLRKRWTPLGDRRCGAPGTRVAKSVGVTEIRMDNDQRTRSSKRQEARRRVRESVRDRNENAGPIESPGRAFGTGTPHGVRSGTRSLAHYNRALRSLAYECSGLSDDCRRRLVRRLVQQRNRILREMAREETTRPAASDGR